MTRKKIANPEQDRQIAKLDQQAAEVADLWFSGLTQREIGDRVKLKVNQVYRILKRSKELWREWRVDNWDAHMTAELARIDRIESEAWAAWERSKSASVETLDESKDTAWGPMQTNRTKKTTRYGEAMFLKVALECVDQRLKLLGAFDFAKLEGLRRGQENSQSDTPVGVLVVVETPDQANKILGYEDWDRLTVQGAAQPVE